MREQCLRGTRLAKTLALQGTNHQRPPWQEKDMLHETVTWLVSTVGQWGYPGIVVLMALESSFFPFPSEVVIPPAAYLAATGEMDIGMVILCGVLGSLLGAVFNYWLALRFGGAFFKKYGRYFLISPRTLENAHRFLRNHGHISTFIGRLIPGVRQYVSLPAGMAKMNFFVFCVSTVLGAGIWVVVLAGVGYWFGRNQKLVMHTLHGISGILLIGCVVLGLVYWRSWKSRQTGTAQRKAL